MTEGESGLSVVEQTAADALLRAIADPGSRPLIGTKSRPGVFTGRSKVVVAAAELCVDKAWLVKTDQIAGRGKNARELYRVSDAGTEFATRYGEVAVYLRNVCGAVDSQTATLVQIRESVTQSTERVSEQAAILTEMARRAGLRLKCDDHARSESSEAPAADVSAACSVVSMVSAGVSEPVEVLDWSAFNDRQPGPPGPDISDQQVSDSTSPTHMSQSRCSHEIADQHDVSGLSENSSTRSEPDADSMVRPAQAATERAPLNSLLMGSSGWITTTLVVVLVILQIVQMSGSASRSENQYLAAAIESADATSSDSEESGSASPAESDVSEPAAVARPSVEFAPESDQQAKEPATAITCAVAEAVVEWVASAGTQVSAGDVVAKLESPELEERRYRHRIALESARSALIFAQRDAAIARLEAASFEMEVSEGRSRLAELSVLEARQALASGETLRNHAQWMARKGYATTESVRMHELNCERARHVLDQALSERDLTIPAELTRDQQKLETRREATQRLAALADERVAVEESRLRAIDAEIDKLTILAPIDGIVRPADRGMKLSLVGQRVLRGQPILLLATTNK
ncbi:MAG: hypothetical protein HQ518_26455 [Rhodopirellula sp.]|nr:hypothetical protein [Rhodopirellula sp.]